MKTINLFITLLFLTTISKAQIITSNLGLNDNADCIAIQNDGKIVIGGSIPNSITEDNSIIFMRFKTDGTLDASFGVNGVDTLPDIDYTEYKVKSIKITSDNKILFVVAESSIQSDLFPVIGRLNANGTLDNTFGTDGFVSFASIDLGFNDFKASKGLFLSDGSIIVAGTADNDFAFIKVNPNGTINTTIGINGLAIKKSTAYDLAYTAGLGQNDDIYIGGLTETDKVTASRHFAITRFLSNGKVDSSFGTNGLVITTMGFTDQIKSLFVQPDNSVIAYGDIKKIESTYNKLGIVKYSEIGTLDKTFGSNGIFTMQLPDSLTIFSSKMIVLPDNNFLVESTVSSNSNKYIGICLVRINGNGTIDNTFGSNGLVFINTKEYKSLADDLIATSNNKILLCGKAVANKSISDPDFMILGLNYDGSISDNLSTDVKEYFAQDITLYPNPTLSSFSVDTDKDVLIQIYSINGVLVYTKKVSGKELISVNELHSGLYVVKIITNDSIIPKSLIIK